MVILDSGISKGPKKTLVGLLVETCSGVLCLFHSLFQLIFLLAVALDSLVVVSVFFFLTDSRYFKLGHVVLTNTLYLCCALYHFTGASQEVLGIFHCL